MCCRSPTSPCTWQPRSPWSASAVEPAAARDAVVGAPKEELDTDRITTEILGDRLYVNWMPGGDIRASAVAVGKFLEAEGCGNGYFQLESGDGMTLPLGLTY